MGRSAANRYFYTLLNQKNAESLEKASNIIESANKALFQYSKLNLFLKYTKMDKNKSFFWESIIKSKDNRYS